MKVSKLKPNPQNPRTISDEAFEKLCESIERDPEFMRLRPIVHDDFLILGGNQRYRAIKFLGMKDIPNDWAVEAKDLTDDQKRRFILVDNAPEGMAGGWDVSMLEEHFELPELKDLGFDLVNLGLEDYEIDYDKEWQGMPEFENNPKAVRSLIIHFETEEDVAEFISLIGQTITDKTKSLWFPEKEREDLKSQSYINES